MGHKGPFGAVLGHFGTITELSVKNGVWGPIEWVGDQLSGWGGATLNLNSKRNALCFLKFFDFGLGWPLPTQSTGPQPIQLVPKHRF